MERCSNPRLRCYVSRTATSGNAFLIFLSHTATSGKVKSLWHLRALLLSHDSAPYVLVPESKAWLQFKLGMSIAAAHIPSVGARKTEHGLQFVQCHQILIAQIQIEQSQFERQ